MRTRKHRGFLSLLCLLATLSVGNASDAVAAEHLLEVSAIISNGSCTDPNGGYYFEAWGYNSSNQKVCEVFEAADSTVPLGAVGMCDSSATQHRGALTVRNASTYSFVALVSETPTLTAWGRYSPGISPQIQSSSTCSGGARTTLITKGFDTST